MVLLNMSIIAPGQVRWLSYPRQTKKVYAFVGTIKFQLYREISEDKYPLSNVDDMFAKLAGGKTFTNLNLTQAYAQLELQGFTYNQHTHGIVQI